jgi:hypothetical protein
MAVQVQPPVRKPRQGGIKAVAGDFILEARLNAPEGSPVWEDATCGFSNPTWIDCVKPEDAEDKVGDGITQYDMQVGPFARYKGVECYLGGDADGPTFQQQAADALAAGEDRPLEAALWVWVAAAASPGTAANIVAAIGAAEQFADTAYVGQPILVMSRDEADAAFAASALVRENGQLVSPHGTPVLASGEVPDGKVGIIGGLSVYAGTPVVRQVDQWTENKALGIAERVYAAGVDCDFRHLINVTAP